MEHFLFRRLSFVQCVSGASPKISWLRYASISKIFDLFCWFLPEPALWLPWLHGIPLNQLLWFLSFVPFCSRLLRLLGLFCDSMWILGLVRKIVLYYNVCYFLITSSESYHVLAGKPFLLDSQLQVFWRPGRAIRHQRPASQGDSATKGGWFEPLFTASLQCPLNYLCTLLIQAGLYLTAFSWVQCDKGAHRESKSLGKIALVSNENFMHSYIVPGLDIICLIILLSQKRTIEPMEVSWLTWGQADLRSSSKFPFSKLLTGAVGRFQKQEVDFMAWLH